MELLKLNCASYVKRIQVYFVLIKTNYCLLDLNFVWFDIGSKWILKMQFEVEFF